MMEIRSTLVSLIFALIISGVQPYFISCDDGWTGFSESPSCYLFAGRQRETFQDAQNICQNYGAQLAKIDKESERNFLTTTIGQEFNEKVWVGMKYQNDEWEWTFDNSTVDTNVIQWQDESIHECGGLVTWGKLNSYKCSETLYYVCEKNLGVPKKCADGWEHYGESCYKRYHHEQRPWDEARGICIEQNSDLIVINNHIENNYVYEFASQDGVNVWLGLRENETESKYFWVNGVVNGGENVVADVWESEEPKERHGKGAGIMASASKNKWSTRDFDQSLSFVCEKGVGDYCLFGLVQHAGSCYDFYLNPDIENVPWEVAKKTCTDSGMNMITEEDKNQDDWITQHLYQTGIFTSPSSINGMWLGYYETDTNSQAFESTPDGTPLAGDRYDARKINIEYNEQEQDCLFAIACPDQNTTDCSYGAWPSHRWNTDSCSNPSMRHIPGCQMKVGDSIDISNLMHPKKYCPEGWGQPFSENCYLPVPQEETFGSAQAFCRSNNSNADVVSIFSLYENAHVKQMAKDLGDFVWIGLRDIQSEGSWQWADGTPLGRFKSWAENEPNGGAKENCADLGQEGWRDFGCDAKKPFVCKMAASTDPSGNPVLPDTSSTMPPSTNCGYMGDKWVENPNTGMCYSLVTDQRYSWSDAREYCREIGGYHEKGDLASIDTKEEQEFFNSWFTLVQNYESIWIGLSDLNNEGAFTWSDGSPFAFINWKDTEPNGGEGENCGEFKVDSVTKGQWNDYDCNGQLPWLCEKRGDNYQEPPKPLKPQPSCPTGWKKGVDRCYYVSYDFQETANNWTEASQKCKGVLEGATLTSIRSQADEDFISYDVFTTYYIGGSDAAEEGTWKWEDGTPFKFTHWANGEPNGNTTENCLEVNYYMEWNDISCGGNDPKYFLCSSDIKLCPEDWYFFDGMCWYFSGNGKAPWQSAQDICQDGSSYANLLSIHSQSDNDFVQRVSNTNPWIGLQIDYLDDYHWVDDSVVDFQNWKNNEPNNIDSEKCTAMSHGNGKWTSEDCQKDKSFICRFKNTHYTSCPSGWEKWNSNCYLLQTGSNKMAFQDAESSCVGHGGHLASIVSHEELEYIQVLIADYHKCGNDYWTADDDSQTCYYYSTEKVDWFTAKASCEESSSSLTTIKSKEKNTKLLSLVPNGYSFWTGLSDNATEGSWLWVSSNETLDCQNGFCDWIDGEPNGYEYENCVEVINGDWIPQGSWNDASCTETLTNYICEKPYADNVRKELWIGLNDLDSSQTLTWTDGSYVTFTQWSPGQPYHHAGDKLQCAFLTVDNEMQLTDCHEQRLSLCKRPAEITTVPPNSYGCGEGQFAYQASCYELNHQYRTFSSAKADCESGDGNLIAINDSDEQAKLDTILSQTFGTFFLGLEFNPVTNTYAWVNGDSLNGDINHWDHYQPDPSEDRNCAKVSPESYGFWWMSKCDETASYICEYPRKGYTVPPTTTTTVAPEAQCPSYEWTKVGDQCFRLFTQELTFSKAEDYCQTVGGHLASLHSADEETNALNEQSNYGYYFLWIGLRQNSDGSDGGYYWTDDSPLDYSPYKSGFPDSHGGVDNCFLNDWEYSYSYGWENHNCESEMPFLCKVQAGFDPPPTVVPPTVPPSTPCDYNSQDGWIKMAAGDDTDFCYKFVATTADSDTWSQAEYYCQQEGGHLASVHDNNENNFIMNTLHRNLIDNAFLGMSKDNDDQFYWTDGTVLDYNSWGPGEPNNYLGFESCCTMFSGTGRWNDAYCSQPANGYVCKRPANPGQFTTAKPTPMPEGHCAEGYFEFRGYCYKLSDFSGDVSLHRNWTEAREECKSMGLELVSIHSEQEQSFLKTILASHDTNQEVIYEFWIGFHDFVHWNYDESGTYVWSDESSVDYTNWARGEPSESGVAGKECVQMWAHDDTDVGQWNDINCDNRMPYICKSKASLEVNEPPPTPKCEKEYGDYDKFTDGCYKLVEESLTWSQAEERCANMDNSHLISILKESENAFTMVHFDGGFQSELVWIGLSNKVYHDTFKWSDGWPMQISKWAMDPPPNLNTDLCVAFNTTDGKWYPLDCEQKYPSLCKHSESVPPTPGPNGDCPAGSFKDLDPSLKYCYYFEYTGILGWDESSRACKSLGHGAELASVHSELEDNAIFSEIQKQSSNVWIGLFTTTPAEGYNATYHWTDNTPLDLINWQDGEPNGATNFEHCVEKYANQNGKWNDAACTVQSGYVCKAAKVQVTPSPTHPSPVTNTTKTTPSSGSSVSNQPTESSSSNPTSSTGSTSTSSGIDENNDKTSAMSGGTIAIVVIVCLLAAAGGVVFMIFLWRRDTRLRKMLGFQNQQSNQNNQNSFENVGYDNSSSELSSSQLSQ